MVEGLNKLYNSIEIFKHKRVCMYREIQEKRVRNMYI